MFYAGSWIILNVPDYTSFWVERIQGADSSRSRHLGAIFISRCDHNYFPKNSFTKKKSQTGGITSFWRFTGSVDFTVFIAKIWLKARITNCLTDSIETSAFCDLTKKMFTTLMHKTFLLSTLHGGPRFYYFTTKL